MSADWYSTQMYILKAVDQEQLLYSDLYDTTST